jgi:inner membrane transporter RhtA
MSARTSADAGVTGAGSGVGMAVGAMVAMQLATALSRPLTAEIGAPALTFLRMAAAAGLMMAVIRPNFRSLSVAAIRAAVLLGGCLGLMSLATFAAVSWLPLGMVATIAFLGPLAVAVLGARGGRGPALALAGLAALGLVLMLAPAEGSGWSVHPAGLALALLAALSWGLYILLTRRLGGLVKGNEGLCLSLLTATLILAPSGAFGLASAEVAPGFGTLLAAAALGLLAPTLTCGLEMKALRVMGTQSFGILMSLEPAIATLLGLVLLAEVPSALQLAGMACVMLACGAAVRLPERRSLAPT